MFYLDPKIKVTFLKVTNPGKSIPFSRVPQKSLDRKPLRFSTVFGDVSDFIDIIHKVLAPVQPYGESKPCKIQGLFPGQAIGNAGNNQNTIQNDVFLIPPKKTIRFIPHQKPFVFYHTKHTNQSDVLIIPFSFNLSSIHTNRIYSTWGLFSQKNLLKYVDLWPVVQNDNQPLTFEHIKVILSNNHIQTTSLNEVLGHRTIKDNLIYTSHIRCKNLNKIIPKPFTFNEYSSKTGINKMHKKYAFILKCKYVYISYLVYVQNWFYGFKSALAEKERV